VTVILPDMAQTIRHHDVIMTCSDPLTYNQILLYLALSDSYLYNSCDFLGDSPFPLSIKWTTMILTNIVQAPITYTVENSPIQSKIVDRGDTPNTQIRDRHTA
jgi:hypothetical protein